MKEREMEFIGELFKKCLIHGKYIGNEVKEFRAQYQNVQYSFDRLTVEV
jgi:hypothetical protein